MSKLSNQSGESRQELAILMAEMKVEMESVLTEKQISELVKKQFDKTKKEAKATATSLQAFGSLVEKLGATKKLIVYEGLPRGSKNELRELAAKHKTIKIDGFLFYEKALAPSETTLERLRGTLCDHRSLIPYRGAKFCGGFHPDFWMYGEDADLSLRAWRAGARPRIDPSSARPTAPRMPARVASS